MGAEAIALEPAVLPRPPRWLHSQPARLFVGQTDRENGPAPGGWNLAGGQGPWQLPPRDRTICPLGPYRGPEACPLHPACPPHPQRCQRQGQRQRTTRGAFILPLVRGSESSQEVTGKLDGVIDQMGVWGLSMDFIYLCFPWSLLL